MPRVPAMDRNFQDDHRINRMPVLVTKIKLDAVNRRLAEIETRLKGISTDGLDDITLHAFVDSVLELEQVREELIVASQTAAVQFAGT